jgi:hypothetical protein
MEGLGNALGTNLYCWPLREALAFAATALRANKL